MVIGGDGEFVLVFVSVVVLVLVNAALKAVRGARFAGEVANDDVLVSVESVLW